MLIRDLGEGGKWYVVAASYPTAMMAKRGWERLNDKIDMRAGDEGVGITRLAPNPDPSTVRSGAPEGRHNVVGVTLHALTATKMEHLLRDGESWEPDQAFADALIMRRARMVMEQAKAGTGRLVIRRPEGRGATITERGNIHEPEPGRG